MNIIPTFIINLKSRTDRKKHVLKEFGGRNEFAINIIEPCWHKVGAVSLWRTIRHILQNLTNENDEFVLICEDDHQFTDNYSINNMYKSIEDAKRLDADILLGGVSWFEDAVQILDNILWIRAFSGTQFMVIFKHFFRTIINAPFYLTDIADHKICSLTTNRFTITPFISVQRDFGYSDVTSKNNTEGRVERLFEQSLASTQILKKVSDAYKNISVESPDRAFFENVIIPTYIINLPERTDRLEYIEKQFAEKTEFDVKIIPAIKHETGAVGLWLSIRKIIEVAIENDDDVILICEDDHEFTEYYSKEFLLQNIIEVHEQGADYLSGGTAYFNHAVLIAKNRYWLNPANSTQFIVIYKKFFKAILDEPFDNNVVADIFLAKMTSNKMVIYPFISTQRDFGYSDVTPIHTSSKDFVKSRFEYTSARLEIITDVYHKYGLYHF